MLDRYQIRSHRTWTALSLLSAASAAHLAGCGRLCATSITFPHVLLPMLSPMRFCCCVPVAARRAGCQQPRGCSSAPHTHTHTTLRCNGCCMVTARPLCHWPTSRTPSVPIGRASGRKTLPRDWRDRASGKGCLRLVRLKLVPRSLETLALCKHPGMFLSMERVYQPVCAHTELPGSPRSALCA